VYLGLHLYTKIQSQIKLNYYPSSSSSKFSVFFNQHTLHDLLFVAIGLSFEVIMHYIYIYIYIGLGIYIQAKGTTPQFESPRKIEQ